MQAANCFCARIVRCPWPCFEVPTTDALVLMRSTRVHHKRIAPDSRAAGNARVSATSLTSRPTLLRSIQSEALRPNSSPRNFQCATVVISADDKVDHLEARTAFLPRRPEEPLA